MKRHYIDDTVEHKLVANFPRTEFDEKITKNIFSLLSKRFFILCNVRNWLEIFMKCNEVSLITKRHCEGDIVEHKVVANFPWTDSTVQNGRKKSIIFEKVWIIQTVYNVYIADHICQVLEVYEYSRQMQVANKVSCHRREKYVDDEGCLIGVAAVAVETAVVVALDAMATIVAVAEVQLGVAVSARWRQQ